MRADVVSLPSQLKAGQIEGRVVVVLDVLRATTTMITALAQGVREIRIFPDTQSARQAAKANPGAILCGEENCLKPPGFNLGNSPGDLSEQHSGRTLFMSTTNGTRAILAASGAAKILIGALVNATALANHLRRLDSDPILLCAGTNGELAMEDVIGAGAILDSLGKNLQLASDSARLALGAFRSAKPILAEALKESSGGANIIRAGLAKDIDYAARLDAHPIVGVVAPGEPIKVVRETTVG